MTTRPHRPETGSVSLEAVLILPVVLVTLLAVIQVTLWAYADRVTDTAAREGARAARLSGLPADGEARAEDFLRRLGATTVLTPNVTARVTATGVTVEVHGLAATLLPAFRLAVAGHSSGAIERFDPGVIP